MTTKKPTTIARTQSELRESTTTLTQRGQRTYNALLAAARVVFERDGYLEARIVDISKEAGVANGSFYTYFSSKEEIYGAVAARIPLEYFTEVGELSGTISAAEAIRLIEDANRAFITTYQANAKFMRTLEEVTMYLPNMAAAREERVRGGIQRVSLVISTLQSAGLADPSLNPTYAAVAMMSMVMRYTSVWLTDVITLAVDLEFDTSIETLTQVWVQAIGLDWGARFAT